MLNSNLDVKGNPNFQGILNWIIQILHYYCRKQHKNIEKSRIIEQNVAISALLSAYCDLHFLCLPQQQGIFSFWTQSWTSQVIIRAVDNFIFCFEKISFSKLSPAKYHCLHKRPYIFHVFSYRRTFLQISLL